ncbi:MAG: hypothetical protein OXT70_01120 [Chloroflexota bacterium]|nr:hypothetical protein [Chloroflexota bacterium]
MRELHDTTKLASEINRRRGQHDAQEMQHRSTAVIARRLAVMVPRLRESERDGQYSDYALGYLDELAAMLLTRLDHGEMA